MTNQDMSTSPRMVAKDIGNAVELPNFQIMDDPDGQGRGEYVMREVLEAALERQGFKIKPKE